MMGKLNKKDILALSYITLLSIVAVAYGFSIIPSPVTEQVIAKDHKRVVDLANIKTAVDNYYQDNNTLPQSLDELNSQAYDDSTPLDKTDPETKQPYEYNVASPYSYTICATFTTDSNKEKPDQYDTTDSDYSAYQGQFKHPMGLYCFTEHEQPPYTPPIYDHPTTYPCRGGKMCPMMPSTEASPGVYNSTDETPTPAPIKGDGTGGNY